MAIFSKTCEYAIRAVFFIAYKTAEGGKVGIKDIATGIDSPEVYLAKILQDLSRKNIISSRKGPNGGFYLDPAAYHKPLSEIKVKMPYFDFPDQIKITVTVILSQTTFDVPIGYIVK